MRGQAIRADRPGVLTNRKAAAASRPWPRSRRTSERPAYGNGRTGAVPSRQLATAAALSQCPRKGSAGTRWSVERALSVSMQRGSAAFRPRRQWAPRRVRYCLCLEGAARVRIDRLRAALPRFVQRWHEPGPPPLSNHSPPDLDEGPVQISGSRGCRRRAHVAVGIEDDGRLIPAASIGQRQ